MRSTSKYQLEPVGVKEEKPVISLATYHTLRQQTNTWFQVVALLRFDLEQGAVVDALYPAGVLHDREEKDLMALGFPESHQLQHGEGSLHYSFRLRHHSKLPLVATSANTYSFGYAMFS